jgi:ribosomal protein S18 acetylase RimI-like enzyme
MTPSKPKRKPHGFEIVQAGLRDLNSIRELEKVSFPLDAWPLIELIGVLSLPSMERWKAVADSRLIGFVAADIRKRQDLAWIATIAVHPDYRGQGIGDALMEKVEGLVGMPAMRLSARASNEQAIALYKKRGYEKIAIWPRYYQGDEDAVVMEKSLTSPR